MMLLWLIAGGVYLGVMLHVIIASFSIQNVASVFPGLSASSASIQAIRILALLLLAIEMICYAGIIQLAALHAKLVWTGRTTTEYLREKRHLKKLKRRETKKSVNDVGDDGRSSSSDATRVNHWTQDGHGNTSLEKPAPAAPAHGSISTRPLESGQVRLAVQVASSDSASDSSDVLWQGGSSDASHN